MARNKIDPALLIGRKPDHIEQSSELVISDAGTYLLHFDDAADVRAVTVPCSPHTLITESQKIYIRYYEI